MMRLKYIVFTLFLIGLCSCTKEDYEIDYQEGYPSILSGNWTAFEFRGGTIENDALMAPYSMVTSLDPNRQNALILDKLYGSDVRVRAEYSDTSFSVVMGEVLETVSTNVYDIKYISLEGYITSNPVLVNTLYSLAVSFYDNLAFDVSYIEDLLFLRAGFYDEYKAQIDTVLILGYRTTGFEEVSY